MGISGRLVTFSLSEVLQILDRGRKTGLLTIQRFADEQKHPVHYIWLHNGRIVRAASSLNRKGLLSMLHQRKWLGPELLSEINQLRELETPLGSYLKVRGDLQVEQLKLLFHVQVLQRVCTRQSIQTVQKTTFRLISAGLIEEVAIEAYLPKVEVIAAPPETLLDAPKQKKISSSFFKNLLGFLRSKV